MVVSRRSFVALGQWLAVAAALPGKVFGANLFASLGNTGKAPLLAFTKDTFLPLVNSSFAVRSGGVTKTWLTLLSVEDLTRKTSVNGTHSGTATPHVDSFALHFLGTGDILAQGTHELEHHSLGRFDLFVVPSKAGGGRETYTAIFGHLLGSQPAVHPPQIKLNRRVL